MKKILLLSVLLGVVGIAMTILFTEEAKPIPLAVPSQDTAEAFPQFDQIYRDKGELSSIRKSQFVVFDYLQFHEGGTVVSTTRSVSSFNELDENFYADLAKELASDGEGSLRREGRHLIEDGEVGYGLGHHGSAIPDDIPLEMLFDIFHGEIRGDQIWIKKTQGKDREPYGAFQAFAPIGPEARWEIMTGGK